MQKKLIVINALDKDSYNDCHIKGSISIPLADLAKAAQQFDKDAEIVVYCASNECPVSSKAWHLLNDLGFTNVWAYEGGMREWRHMGLPAEGECVAEYIDKAHGQLLPTDPKIKLISADELREKLGIPVAYY